MGQFENFTDIMTYEDHGNFKPLIKGDKLILELNSQLQVQRGKRLVQKKEFRFIQQSAQKRYPLFLASGQSMRLMISELHETRHIQKAVDEMHILFILNRVSQVFPHRHVGKKIIILENETDPALLNGLMDAPCTVKPDLSVNLYKPFVRSRQPGYHSQYGGFPRAGVPEQGNDFVPRNFKIHVELEGSVAGGEMFF